MGVVYVTEVPMTNVVSHRLCSGRGPRVLNKTKDRKTVSRSNYAIIPCL